MSRRCRSYHGGSVVVIAVVLVGLSATAGAADRAARFAEYDARRTQALRVTPPNAIADSTLKRDIAKLAGMLL